MLHLPPSLLLLLLTTLPAVHCVADYTISSFDAQQANGLTPACNTIYTDQIQNCSPSDFNTVNPCSASCIDSLSNLQTEAQVACSGQNIPDQSLLRFFTNGQGVNELCTAMKQVATTLITSTSPTGTATSSATQVSATTKPTSSSGAQKSSGVLALSKPALLAVVISIFIAFAIIFVIAVVMYRKHYRK